MGPDPHQPSTPATNDHQQPECEPEGDDAVIGRALRRSLIAIVAFATLVGAVVWLRTRPREAAPEQTIEIAAPAQPTAGPVAPPALPFTDVTTSAGVDFVHENGARGDKLLPESMGSGVALFDYDGDGDADLLLLNGQAWPQDATRPTAVSPTAVSPPTRGSRLYRNDSTPGRIRFTDVSHASGIDRLAVYATGVAVADIDGDGRRDLFIAALGSNRMLRQRPDHGFTDVTADFGVAGAEDAWSTSAAFFDADRDGDLDLFVGNYVHWSREIDLEVDYRLTGVGRAYGPPINYQGSFSYLYRNDLPDPQSHHQDAHGAGDLSFTDVSATSGIRIRNPATGVPVGKALGLLPIDGDGDGWMDLLVANDTVRNFFFHNLGDSAPGAIAFEEVGELWGLAYGRAGEATGAMGVDAGYLLDERDLGFAIGNFANEMTSVYLAQDDPTLFADDAIGLGIAAASRSVLTFGVLVLDVDLDGHLDVLQTNGHLENQINTVDPNQTYAQPSQLFWNAGTGARQPLIAVDLSDTGDLATPRVGRGSACADLDGDGDLDLVVTQTGRPAVVLRNDQTLRQHWLRVRLIDRPPNRDAIGARITLTASGMRQRRQVNPTRSYASQSELTVTFGLGTVTDIEGLTVTWPDGQQRRVAVDAVDRLLTISRDNI